jgi:4-hydroxy-tetrahydrodipicolinate synthase
MTKQLTGIIPPLVTPFTADGDIDEKLLRGQARFMLSKGVHGVCMGGSTGEGHTLTRASSSTARARRCSPPGT